MIQPCENCGEVDEHACVIDGVEYGPYDDTPAEELRSVIGRVQAMHNQIPYTQPKEAMTDIDDNVPDYEEDEYYADIPEVTHGVEVTYTTDTPAPEEVPTLPGTRPVPDPVVVTLLLEEHDAKAWLNGEHRAAAHVDSLIGPQIRAALEARAPISLDSRVVYAGTKRAGIVVSMHSYGRTPETMAPYATVLWDEWTKSPFTTVPLENLRKE